MNRSVNRSVIRAATLALLAAASAGRAAPAAPARSPDPETTHSLPAAAPRVARLSASAAARSGRLVITGSGFGSAQGTVRIGGHPAIVTRWGAGEVHAYVPEEAPVGKVEVVVESAAGAAGAPVGLSVEPRAATGGAIRWTFDMDRWMSLQFVEVAPDGTVYVSDHLGLYALGPGGALLWFSPQSGGGNAISVGPDGTIYTGTQRVTELAGRVRALDPDGSLRWEFVPPPGSSPGYLGAGPNVGPDGNVYAVQDPDDDEGLGFFSLTPDGDLRWSDTTSATLFLITSWRSELVFASDRLYGGVVSAASGGQPLVFAYDLEGNELWSASQLNTNFQSYPRVDPFGRAVGRWGQTGLCVTEPDGTLEWFTVHPSQINVLNLPTVDSQGNVYAGASRSEMWSVDAGGDIRWVLPSELSSSLSKTGIAPDDSVLVAHYFRTGEPQAITGHDPADGSRLWLAEIEDVGGSSTVITSLYPRFSPDSSTAYVTSSSGGPAVDYSRITAICTEACPVTYCTAGTSASGCQAAIAATGTASATAPSGFTLSATGVEGQKAGLFYFGTSGRQANPWGNGSSFQCVVPPLTRAGLLAESGSTGACDGSFAQDLNALWCPSCPRPSINPGPGAVVQAQLWYRDPLSSSNQTTSLSDAIEFGLAP